MTEFDLSSDSEDDSNEKISSATIARYYTIFR